MQFVQQSRRLIARRVIHRTKTSISFNRLRPAPESTSKATPLPRSSHGVSALGGGRRIVIYGGENEARTPIAEAGQALWLAEKTGDDWKWVSPLADDGAPPPRVAHSQAAVADTVYIFGGRRGVEMGEIELNDLWKLNIATTGDKRMAKWTEVIPAGDVVPEARSFHKMISILTDLYVFGGCGVNGRLNDLWKFDTLTKEWVSLGSSHLLKGRGGPNILSLRREKDSIDAKIAIVAGFAGEETNDGHIFENNSWEAHEMEGLSDIRKRSVSSFGSFPHLNKCIIFGGEVDPSNLGHEGAGNFERDVLLLDGTSGALLSVVKPKDGAEKLWPEARGWADASVTGDSLYLFGGLAGNDTSPLRLNDLWECRISS